MKKLIICMIMIAAGLNVSAQYNVTIVGTGDNTVTMRCVGFGKKAAAAASDAELSAVKTLLFAGVSNTKYSSPLIQEEKSAVEDRHKKVFKDFYDGGYKRFVESSVIVTPFGKNALKQKSITLDICIRVNQLRNYLEQTGIIRKFGL